MYLLRVPAVIFILSFLLPSAVFAQGSLSGKLVDPKNSPVSYATVTLMHTDSSVVNGDLSKDDGSFSITGTGTGNFRIRIESIGMKTKTMDVTIPENAPDKKLGNIKLDATDNKLKEVSVVGEKAVMELKVDKKVFNVEKNTTTAGGSATDVLQNVPSVSVDASGNVSLRGKSDVTILIDGKPATMLGSDVNSALQSLSAASIENVEVITNPSAKYDAQGTGGIINIITKKDTKFGLNGNVTLGAGTRDKYNGNLGLNVRKGKWNAFLNSSFRLNSTYNNVITDRQDNVATTIKPSLAYLQSYHTYEHVPRDFNGNFNTIGVTYDADKNNSITLTENVNMMEFKFKDVSDYDVYSHPRETGDILLHQYRNSSFSGEPRSSSTAVDYKHKFAKKDEELSVDGTFAYTAMTRYQDYYTRTDTMHVATPPIQETAPGTGNNSTLTLWADYTDPLFTKNGKLGLGFKSQLYWFNSSNSPRFVDPVSGTIRNAGLTV
jgi:outer membrane receptor protein involved in Fe transport